MFEVAISENSVGGSGARAAAGERAAIELGAAGLPYSSCSLSNYNKGPGCAMCLCVGLA